MTEDGFDAVSAAARATGQEPEVPDVQDASEDAVEEHAAAEGTDTDSVGTIDSLRDALFQTDPDTPLEAVESPWDPDLGGKTRVFRGIQKMLGFSAMPAIADLLIGALEELSKIQADDGADQDDDEDDEEEVDPFA